MSPYLSEIYIYTVVYDFLIFAY